MHISTIPFSFIFDRKYRRNTGICLCYHEVRNSHYRGLPRSSIVMTEEYFEKHVRFIANNLRVLAPDEFLRRMAAFDLPPRACMITFDDGFDCTARIAYPILERYGLPFMIFACSGYIKHGLPWDYHILQWIINTAKFRGARVIFFDEIEFIFDNTSLSMLNRSKSVLVHIFQNRLSSKKRKGFLEHLGAELDAEEVGPLPKMMTEEIVRTLSNKGVSIGSHTEWHISVEADGADEFKAQAQRSKQQLEEMSGKPVKYFAYPYGAKEHCWPAKTLVKEVGYDFAFAGLNRPSKTLQLPYMINRIGGSRGVFSLIFGLLECKSSQLRSKVSS